MKRKNKTKRTSKSKTKRSEIDLRRVDDTPTQYDPSEWDETRSVKVHSPKRVAGVSTSIRLPAAMVAKLRTIAKRKGEIGYQTLLKIWIAERLEKESA